MKIKVIKFILLVLIFAVIFKVGLMLDPKLKDAHFWDQTDKKIMNCN